jgi:endonuclease YncB( thermonuclease family)
MIDKDLLDRLGSVTSVAKMRVLMRGVQDKDTDIGTIRTMSKEAFEAIKFDLAAGHLKAMRHLTLSVSPEVRNALLLDIEAGGIDRFSPVLQIAVGTVGLDEKGTRYSFVDDAGKVAQDSSSAIKEIGLLPVSHIKDVEQVIDDNRSGYKTATYKGRREMYLSQEAYTQNVMGSTWVFNDNEKSKAFKTKALFEYLDTLKPNDKFAELQKGFTKGSFEFRDKAGKVQKLYTPREAAVRVLESLLEMREKNGAVIGANIQFDSERLMTLIGSYIKEEDGTINANRFAAETDLIDKNGKVFSITEEAINTDPRLTRFFGGEAIKGFQDIRAMMSSTYKNPGKTNILDPTQTRYRSKVARLNQLGAGYMSSLYLNLFESELRDKGLSSIDQQDVTTRAIYSSASMLTRDRALEEAQARDQATRIADQGRVRTVNGLNTPQPESMIPRGAILDVVDSKNGPLRRLGIGAKNRKALVDDTFSMTSVQYNLNVLFQNRIQKHTAGDDLIDQLDILNKVNPVARFLATNARLSEAGGFINSTLAFLRETAAVLNTEARTEIEDVWKLFTTKSTDVSYYDFISQKNVTGPLAQVKKYRSAQRAMFQLRESMQIWTASMEEIEDGKVQSTLLAKDQSGKVIIDEIDGKRTPKTAEGFTLTEVKTTSKQMVRADGLTISELRNVGRDYTVEDTARFYYQSKFSELGGDKEDTLPQDPKARKEALESRRAEALKYATGQIREEYAQLPNVKQSGFTLEDLEEMSSEIEERYKETGAADEMKRQLIEGGKSKNAKTNESLVRLGAVQSDKGEVKIEDALVRQAVNTQGTSRTLAGQSSILLDSYTSNYIRRHAGKIAGGAIAAGAGGIMAADAAYEYLTKNNYDPTRVSTLDIIGRRTDVDPFFSQFTEGNDNSSEYEPSSFQKPFYLAAKALRGASKLSNSFMPDFQTDMGNYVTGSNPVSNMSSSYSGTGVDLNKFDISVEDADTVKLISKANANTEFQVRFSGVDTPETRHTGGGTGLIIGEGNVGQPMANEASNYTKNLLLSTKNLSLSLGEKDAYGRFVGVFSSERGKNINMQMVQAGVGQALPWGPQKVDTINQKDFLYAEKLAQQTESGIHGLSYYKKYYESLEGRFSKRTFNTLSQISPKKDSRNNPALFAVMNAGTREQASRFKQVRQMDEGLNREIFSELFGGNGDSRQLEALGHQGIAWQIRQQMTDFGSGYRGLDSSMLKKISGIFNELEQPSASKIFSKKDKGSLPSASQSQSLPKSPSTTKKDSSSYNLLSEGQGNKPASKVADSSQEVSDIKKTTPLELMKSSSSAKSSASATQMPYEPPKKSGLSQISMSEKSQSRNLEDIIQPDNKSIATSQGRKQQGNFDDGASDYGKNNMNKIQESPPKVPKSKQMANKDEMMRDNTYLTLAGTMQRNPGRSRTRRS